MTNTAKPLRIDIPVKLAEVKVAFSISALTFEGDLPASIFHLQIITRDTAAWNAKARIIAVFHTNAGHVTLHDDAYNTERMIATGNPYKGLIADLMKRGVEIELCGATATVHKWGNADLLPGVKVNTDVMSRMTELVQEGFAKISESNSKETDRGGHQRNRPTRLDFLIRSAAATVLAAMPTGAAAVTQANTDSNLAKKGDRPWQQLPRKTAPTSTTRTGGKGSRLCSRMAGRSAPTIGTHRCCSSYSTAIVSSR